TRTGEGALLSQKSALAAASPTPQTGASRIRRTQARRASMRSAACATAGHTPARSSRSTSPSIVCSSASRSPVSSRTAVSHAGHAPAWRATASSMGAGSSASTKRSSRSATSAQVMRGSDATPQPGLELAARVVEAAHHRPFRTLEHLADLLVGEPFQLAEEYDRSMIGGQFSDRLIEASADLGVARALEGLVRARSVGDRTGRARPRLVRVQRDLRLLRGTALVVDAEVVRDAVYPGVEGRIALEAVETLVRLREGLLHDVERVLPIA